MKIPYLGKIRLHWCDSCQVPLIRNYCSICKNKGRKVLISPPGDVRPAFKGDKTEMISSITTQFGEISAQKFQHLIENQVILLNKVPYIDRMDEIIIQGEVIGIFRFNIVKKSYELIPKLPLAKEIWTTQSNRYVTVDIGAKIPIIKGASVLSPGILFADTKIVIDDPVIVVCENEVIAVGLAKMTGVQMKESSYGVAVKTKYRKNVPSRSLLSAITNWNQIVEANMQSLEILEREAIDFIEHEASKYPKQVVAYSGGKDSLVTLDLVDRSNVSFEIIFSDTGLEYPETLENIKKVGDKYRKPVIIHENKSWDFWQRFDQFGPPSRNSRWCCKSAKLFPINEMLEMIFPEKKEVLTYIGRRRYESFGRSQEPRVSKNPWIPKQVTAAPIRNWIAFEIFLYIQKHNLKQLLNPLYELGFIRIGCWVCPASSMSDFKIMKQSHPALIAILNNRLIKIQAQNVFPEQYLTWGLWRWKFLPQKIINLMKKENISISLPKSNKQKNHELLFRITNSPSPCVQGGFSTLLSANQMIDLSRIWRLVPILGPVQYNEDLDILSIQMNDQGRIDIFRDGSIILKTDKKYRMSEKITSLITTLYRVMYCDGCGICTYQCSKDALKVDLGVIKVLENHCTHCLTCNEYCTLLKYRDSDSFFYSKEN
ncbi:MAG: phosphoadenosine phosphosulfate reductase family protein [Candidatus Hodarchaeota archaeon]